MQRRGLLKSREMRSFIVVFAILSLLFVPVRGAFAADKIQPMILLKQRTKLRRFSRVNL